MKIAKLLVLYNVFRNICRKVWNVGNEFLQIWIIVFDLLKGVFEFVWLKLRLFILEMSQTSIGFCKEIETLS